MNLILTGRGVDLDDTLREYATSKLTRVQRFFDRIIKMEVEVTEERNRHGFEHRVEVIVQTPRETLRAHADGPDLFAAIDKVTHRLETQLKRFKARLRHRPYREPKGILLDAQDAEAPSSEIVRLAPPLPKPLTPEEARFELDTRGLVFLYFTNAESMRPAVIYRRQEGYGLIESEG